MVDFLLYILFTSLWIWGFRCLFSEGMALDIVGDWLEDSYSEWITKPLFGCTACMSSVHGTISYFVFVNTGIWLWPVFCVCVCGLNFIIVKLTSKERVIIDE